MILRPFQSLRILFVLLLRDQYEIVSTLKDSIINASLLVLSQGFIVLYLFPKMGMPLKASHAIFVGVSAIVCLMVGYTRALLVVYDLRHSKAISYYITLPLPLAYVLARLVLSAVVIGIFNSIPFFVLGRIMMGTSLVPSNMAILLLGALLFLGLILFALIFLIIAFVASFDWFMDSIWEQLIFPLEILGAVFFALGAIAQDFPFLMRIMLCNPITYLMEGMRIICIGSAPIITLSTCYIVLGVSVSVGAILLWYVARKRLDTL